MKITNVPEYNIYNKDMETNVIKVNMMRIKELLLSMELIPDDSPMAATVHLEGKSDVLTIFLNPKVEYAVFINLQILFWALCRSDLDCTAVYNVFENPRVIKVVTGAGFEMVNVLADLLVEKTVYSYT